MSDYRNLPELLKRQGLFCCWRYETRFDKPTKVPYSPRTGSRAKSTDPGGFSAFSAALLALGKSMETERPYSGIGVGLFGNLGAIDIDHCISDTGELSEMAVDIMKTMNAYTEYSPSGKGLRILFTVPDDFQYDKGRYRINNQQLGLEVYIAGATNKYVTITGNTLTPGMDLEGRGEPLRVVLEKYMRRPERQIPQQAPREPVALDDLQLIEKAKRSKGGPKFAALWSGDASGYKSRSEADQALCNILQMVTGMAFIGSIYQEGIVIAYGGGRNGKSTTFNAIGDSLGDYTGSIDIKVITTDRANKGAALATLRGKRLVITGELEEHQRLSVATLKQVASTDRLIVEEKYKQPETVKQSHTLLLFTNHLPRVGSTDDGTWRRLIAVPFNATIQPSDSVQNYGEVLARKCGGAILAWGIEGAVNFVRNGFKLDIPDVVAEATEEYRQREDWLTNFINERCIREPSAKEGARALYLEYKAWATDGGEFVRRENDFAVAMEAAGYRKIQPKGKYHYIGLRIDRSITYGSACGAGA